MADEFKTQLFDFNILVNSSSSNGVTDLLFDFPATWQPAVGWTHNIMGIANASVGKVMGTAKASITSVSGVA